MSCQGVFLKIFYIQIPLTYGSIYGIIFVDGEHTLTKRSKLYAKIVNNPKNINFSQLDKLLKQYGLNAGNPAKVQAIISTTTGAYRI